MTVNVISCLLLTACGKQKVNISLAKNYYQQSLVASKKNKREALVLIDKSLNTNPTPRAYALKATLLYQINKHKESLALFEKIVNDKNTPNTLKADIYNNLACNLLTLGKKTRAKKIWEELTENRFYLSPEVAWFNLGLMALSSVPNKTSLNKNDIKKLNNATDYFRKAIKINLDYIDSYYYLSITLMRLNKLDQAKYELIQVIGIMPSHNNAKQLLKEIDMLKSKQSKS